MRYQSVDVLRTLAILIMVAVHFSENLSGWTLPFQGVGAPMFVVLSGVSFHLWSRGLERKGVAHDTVTRRGVRRGLFLFGVGFAFNLFVWLPEDIFNWDVLTLIGTGLVLLSFARHAPSAMLLGASALAMLLAPPLQLILGASEYWQNPWFDYDWTLQDVLTGFLVAGYFPLFPWIAYPLVGLVVGRWIYHDPDTKDSRARRLAGMGVCLLATSAALVLLSQVTLTPEQHALLGRRDLYPPTTAYTLSAIGIVLTLLGLLAATVDRPNPTPSRWRTLTTRFSRASFTLYLLHHLVHVWPLWIVAEVQGRETTALWMNAMGQTEALLLALLFVALCIPLLGWMERRKIPSVEQLMRWVAD